MFSLGGRRQRKQKNDLAKVPSARTPRGSWIAESLQPAEFFGLPLNQAHAYRESFRRARSDDALRAILADMVVHHILPTLDDDLKLLLPAVFASCSWTDLARLFYDPSRANNPDRDRYDAIVNGERDPQMTYSEKADLANSCVHCFKAIIRTSARVSAEEVRILEREMTDRPTCRDAAVGAFMTEVVPCIQAVDKSRRGRIAQDLMNHRYDLLLLPDRLDCFQDSPTVRNDIEVVTIYHRMQLLTEGLTRLQYTFFNEQVLGGAVVQSSSSSSPSSAGYASPLLTNGSRIECPICLESFAEESNEMAPNMPCLHRICVGCYSRMVGLFGDHFACPICRHKC